MTISETQRLIISKITLQDAPFFVELMNSPHWLKYIGDRQIKTINDAEKHLKKGVLKSYKKDGFGFYKLLLKSENLKIIGICGFIKRKELDDVDIGFGFLPDYEGKGFGYESSIEIMKLAKNKFGLNKIVAITSLTNKNSIKLLEKLGLTYEKTVIPFEDKKKLLLFAKVF
ncbi:MAG: GNAT family N-acetyltransferase [Flavobacteriaceae bacterium]|nr:GNAT family N-acetyltransferase [Flavobacteriaceae bacterium]